MHSGERVPSSTEAKQRLGVLAELPNLLAERGVDVGRWFVAAGIEQNLFESPDNILPFATVTRILEAAVKATGDSDFGLALGARAEPRHLGVVGRYLETSATFGDALVNFVTCHGKYVRGGAPYLFPLGAESLLVGYRLYEPRLPGARNWIPAVLAFGIALFRSLGCGEPERVLLSQSPPKSLQAYRAAYGLADIAFNAEHHGVVYPRAALSRPIATADADAHAQLGCLISEWRPLEPYAKDHVLRVLLPSILAGDASMRATARRLGLHPRALNRHLQSIGASYRDLLNEARFEIALQLLEETNIKIQDLAGLFGYSEVSAFTRFFAARAGLSPTRWRKDSLKQVGA